MFFPVNTVAIRLIFMDFTTNYRTIRLTVVGSTVKLNKVSANSFFINLFLSFRTEEEVYRFYNKVTYVRYMDNCVVEKLSSH